MSSYGRSIVHIVAEGAAARHALTVLAARRGHRPLAHASLREYLDNCAPGQPGCLVLDVCLSQTGGVQLRDVRRSQVPVVMITPPDDVFTAVQAIKDGAFHVMERQPCEHELLAWIEAALAKDIDNRRARGSRGVAARRVIDAS